MKTDGCRRVWALLAACTLPTYFTWRERGPQNTLRRLDYLWSDDAYSLHIGSATPCARVWVRGGMRALAFVAHAVWGIWGVFHRHVAPHHTHRQPCASGAKSTLYSCYPIECAPHREKRASHGLPPCFVRCRSGSSWLSWSAWALSCTSLSTRSCTSMCVASRAPPSFAHYLRMSCSRIVGNLSVRVPPPPPRLMDYPISASSSWRSWWRPS